MTESKIISRSLPVLLTDEEKIQFGRDLAEMHAEYSDLEASKKAAADKFKLDLEEVDARIGYHSRVIRNGHEYRQVECRWRYLFETNVKELIRMDTGEIVETKPIDAEERQLLLQIRQEEESREAAEA